MARAICRRPSMWSSASVHLSLWDICLCFPQSLSSCVPRAWGYLSRVFPRHHPQVSYSFHSYLMQISLLMIYHFFPLLPFCLCWPIPTCNQPFLRNVMRLTPTRQEGSTTAHLATQEVANKEALTNHRPTLKDMMWLVIEHDVHLLHT